MLYKIVAIRDRALDAYAQPFFVVSNGQAIRSFSDEINRRADGNALNKHPEDYDLFYLGTYDDQTGEFDTVRPQQLAVGKDLLVKE